MIRRLLNKLSTQKQETKLAELYRNLIRHEAKIGGQLFGPVPTGCRREFFCLDEHTWVWHEEWRDEYGEIHTKTTRYDVRPHGILKAQEGQPYQLISLNEANNLYQAAIQYEQQVGSEMYNFV